MLHDLYIKDKTNGKIHRIGDNCHDMLTICKWGEKIALRYENLQNGDGCVLGEHWGGYEFVCNEDDHGYNCDPRE